MLGLRLQPSLALPVAPPSPDMKEAIARRNFDHDCSGFADVSELNEGWGVRWEVC